MTEFVRDAVRKIAIVAAFTCCAIMALRYLQEAILWDRWAHDFAVYWRTANEPAEQAYAPHETGPFPYAPTMLIWIAWLGFVPKMLGYFIVVATGLVSFYLACRPYLTKAAFFLALVSAPMVRCVRNGQVSAILSAMMIWACGASNRIAAGAAFGVVASIKPQLVIMAPVMLILNRDWKALVSSGATFLFIVGLSVALYGADLWPEWIGSFGAFHDVLTDREIVGVTPAAIADHYRLPTLPFVLCGVIIGAFIVYLCREAEPLEQATAIGAGSLLASPYAMGYDLVILMPFIASLIMRGRVWNFVAIASLLNPLPLLIVAIELLPKFRQRSLSYAAE